MPDKFTVPEIKGKTIAKKSIQIYTTKLNKLVPSGFSTVDDLITYPDEIIEFINTLADNGGTSPAEKEAEMTEKRMWMAAIDYALYDTPAADKKKYTAFYDTLWKKEGTYRDKDGVSKQWIPRSEYLASRGTH
jgi:hypothetical protein